MVDNIHLMRLIFHCAHKMHTNEGMRGQTRLLILLLDNGTLTQRQLIEITERRSATLSEQLDCMEKSGLICRTTNAEDRRNIDVALTDSGLAAAKDAKKLREEKADRFFGPFSESEKEILAEKLEALAERIDHDEEEKC